MVAGSGGDLLTFSNVVGGTSVKGSGSSTDSGNDTVVLSSSATDINVTFAEGADSLSLAKGASNATVAAGGGNDTVVAALTLGSSSIEAAAGDDSLSISVLSLSTLTAGSGADSINLAKGISSEVYTNQGADFITASGDATTTTLAGVRAQTPSELVEM